MPAPVDPASEPAIARAKLVLYCLGRSRRGLIDARPYLTGTDAGRNYDALISAVEERIDRIRLRGLGPINEITDPDAPVFVEGYPRHAG